jgi:hypothetical protein
VIPVLEELKTQLEHSTEFQAQTQKTIGKIKRNADNLYVDAVEP